MVKQSMGIKNTKSVIAIKPKPPFKPVFQVAARREGVVIKIINGLEKDSPSPSVFLVEAGESPSPSYPKLLSHSLREQPALAIVFDQF